MSCSCCFAVCGFSGAAQNEKMRYIARRQPST